MAIIYDTGASPYLHAFAFNPLESLISRLSYRNQLRLYLQYRLMLEKESLRTGKPVVLAGHEQWGIVSNRTAFGNMIIALEKKANAPVVIDAFGVKDLYYSEKDFAVGLKIIDPNRPASIFAERVLEGMK